jgi:transposase InsO family protein
LDESPAGRLHADDGPLRGSAAGGAGEVWQPGDLQHRPGSQFTSLDFAQLLESYGIRISMDGKGRSLDNVLVEQLWRSVKYEEVYLQAYGQIAEAGRWLAVYVGFYLSYCPTSLCH